MFGDIMDARMLVLNDDFKQLQIADDTMSDFMELTETQLEEMFIKFDYALLLERIKNFYNAIQEHDNEIILSHELLDKKSIISVSSYTIYIKKVDSNMFVPLLKRLFRNHIIMNVD